MSEVTWRQRKIQVTNEKTRLFLLSLREFEDEIKVNGDSLMNRIGNILALLETERFLRYKNEFVRKFSEGSSGNNANP